MAEQTYTKIGHLKSVEAFRQYLGQLGLELPCDEQVLSRDHGSPLARPLDIGGFTLTNRWCIHAMEGWDATTDGQPTENVLRRWQHFGASGAKLIWGGEAFAVQAEGRANPNQLGHVVDEATTEASLRRLLEAVTSAHRSACGNTDGLLVGLQLTHSGRFCKPNDHRQFEPRVAYHHPLLDRRVGIKPGDSSALLGDDEIRRIIDRYIAVAKIAERVGFGFVDVKHCHGYLGHEFLSAFSRPGDFGGSFENRTRFASEIIQGIQAACPQLRIGVRLSAFDQPPYRPDPERSTAGQLGPGVPEDFSECMPYVYGFGCRHNNPLEMDLTEPIAFVKLLVGMGVKLINLSAGSPYYNPHVQRPAMFPPSDGYQPPEDPLVGCVRQIQAVRKIKAACPEAVIVGTAYTYFQDYLPHVAQAVIREGWTDLVGVGRLVLSYWDLPLDTLTGQPMQEKRFCRTFSDCTTAPRNGIVSGCYPLDPHYKGASEHDALKQAKATLRKSLTTLKE